MLFCDIPHKLHDLVTGCRVQPTGWLVQEEDLGTCDELACYANSSLLTSRQAFAYWCADQCVTLFPQSKGREETFDSGLAVGFGYSADVGVSKFDADLELKEDEIGHTVEAPT
jgi:hypothetical protein